MLLIFILSLFFPMEHPLTKSYILNMTINIIVFTLSAAVAYWSESRQNKMYKLANIIWIAFFIILLILMLMDRSILFWFYVMGGMLVFNYPNKRTI